MSRLIENKLNLFFSRVGPHSHALHIRDQLPKYLPYMKDYPELVEKNINVFRPYFLTAPENNRGPALESLLIIAKEIPQVREQIIEKFGDIFYELYPYWHRLRYFNELMSVLELPVSDKDKHLRDLARSVVTLHQPLIIIIGAGFSYDSMPITTELQPLLVKNLREANISSPMEMIREDDEKVWKIAKDNSNLLKRMFSGWCAKTEPAPQHKIVAKMLHLGQISHIVSFNWDDLIERAYMGEFQKNIPKVVNEDIIPEQSSLWKLHGDVENLSNDWVFPYDQGRVFDSLLQTLEQSDKPQFALIVGYNEWEEVVREKLITWLERNIPTVLRVRPNWNEQDPNGICEPAKRFFERLNIYFEMEAKSH